MRLAVLLLLAAVLAGPAAAADAPARAPGSPLPPPRVIVPSAAPVVTAPPPPASPVAEPPPGPRAPFPAAAIGGVPVAERPPDAPFAPPSAPPSAPPFAPPPVLPPPPPGGTPVTRVPAATWATPGCPAPATDPWAIARGPIEIRDGFLLAQPRLTLPATTPDPIPARGLRLRLNGDWGNDFGFDQTGDAEDPTADVRYLVDGEHMTAEAGLRYGLTPCLDVGLRLPVLARGGGALDDLIHTWHQEFGLLDNSRDLFYFDRFRVRGRDAAGTEYRWTEHGAGLGNVELEAHWAFLRSPSLRSWRAAVVGRVGLPTATGPFETGSVDAGLQVVAARRLARRLDLYGGVGGTWFSKEDIHGIEYEPWRGQGWLALEWRFLPRGSLLLQTDASSRLVTNLVEYPGYQWYLHLGGKFDLAPDSRFWFGLTENLIDQQSTVDLGLWMGFEWDV